MTQQAGSRVRWGGPIIILVVHAVALGLLFLLLVFVGHSFADHYKAIGIASTPRFDAVNGVADFLSKYSIALVAVLIADAFVIRWLARKPGRWISAYSHTCLTAVVVAMFIAFTWMINPMVWNVVKPAGAPVNQVAVTSP